MATITPVASAVPRVFPFSMQAQQSIVVDPKKSWQHRLAAGPDFCSTAYASYARAAAAS
jgi:hypothetical protein